MHLLDNGPPAEIINPHGNSTVVLVCEHSSRHIPACLNGLGLDDDALNAHIAWDIGAESVSRHLANSLDAPLVLQRYSRLVYDCNRPPENPSSIPEIGENTPIPGNQNIDIRKRTARIDQIYKPFHASVSQLLDQRAGTPVFVTIHSFTPVFRGNIRDVELGILHDKDARLADALLALAGKDYIARRNEPYGPEDGVAHTINLHGGGAQCYDRNSQ